MVEDRRASGKIRISAVPEGIKHHDNFTLSKTCFTGIVDIHYRETLNPVA